MKAVEGFKIYQATECDWVALRDLSELPPILEDMFGEDVADYTEDYTPAEELTDEQAERLVFTDDDGEKRSFRKELELRTADGTMKPGIFASTEY